MTSELPGCTWELPLPRMADANGLVAVGADLEPGTILHAYATGLFPMPVGDPSILGWWSPDPRGILPIGTLRWSRSMRTARRRFEITVDTAFDRVIELCATIQRPGAWISPEMVEAYRHLHELGWAHSFEAWTIDGELGGGMYGIGIGSFFAGESMFHTVTNGSKVALMGAATTLANAGISLFDVQWCTPHLESLGAVSISQTKYLELLESAVDRPTKLAGLRL